MGVKIGEFPEPTAGGYFSPSEITRMRDDLTSRARAAAAANEAERARSLAIGTIVLDAVAYGMRSGTFVSPFPIRNIDEPQIRPHAHVLLTLPGTDGLNRSVVTTRDALREHAGRLANESNPLLPLDGAELAEAILNVITNQVRLERAGRPFGARDRRSIGVEGRMRGATKTRAR